MLKKLLKYDMRPMIKLWRVFGILVPVLAVVSAISLRYMSSPEAMNGTPVSTILGIFAALLFELSIFAILASSIVSMVFVARRTASNFFSDEGQLTFTLPVKRRDLLNSKIISGLVVNIATFAVVAADIGIILTIGIDFETIQKIGEWFFWFIGSAFETMGALCIAYILEAIVLLLCLAVMSYLLVAICITFAAVIAKKYKLFAAIGIYYIASAIVSFVGQFALMFGSVAVAGIFSSIPEGAILGILALMLLSISLLLSAICVCLYSLELFMLEKKLNLS